MYLLLVYIISTRLYRQHRPTLAYPCVELARWSKWRWKRVLVEWALPVPQLQRPHKHLVERKPPPLRPPPPPSQGPPALWGARVPSIPPPMWRDRVWSITFLQMYVLGSWLRLTTTVPLFICCSVAYLICFYYGNTRRKTLGFHLVDFLLLRFLLLFVFCVYLLLGYIGYLYESKIGALDLSDDPCSRLRAAYPTVEGLPYSWGPTLQLRATLQLGAYPTVSPDMLLSLFYWIATTGIVTPLSSYVKLKLFV